MPRPQYTLRALLVLMLAVGCFFGGIRFERERRRRADEAAALAARNAAEQEARDRVNRELLLQEQKVDRLMDRYDALIAEERRRRESSK